MTQLKWHDAIADDQITDQIVRNTPEVHDIEWADELSPWHDVKRFLMVLGIITACVTIILYSGREILAVLGWS